MARITEKYLLHSKLLGHKKPSTTQIYARVMETKIGEDMAKLQRKLGS